MSPKADRTRTETWTPVFDSVLELTGNARVASVYGAIWRFAQRTGSCYASHRAIAERVGVCRNTVVTCVGRLKALGLVKVVDRPGCPSLITPVPLRIGKAEKTKGCAPAQKEDTPTRPRPEARSCLQQQDVPSVDLSNTDTCPGIGCPALGQLPAQDLGTKRQDKRQQPAVPAGIRLLRGVCKRYPPKETWEFLCECLGQEPDRARLEECYVQWRIAGYKPTNYAWVSNWYRDGIPEQRPERRRRRKANPNIGTFGGSRIER